MRNGVFARGGGFKHVNVGLVGADVSPGHVCWIAVLPLLPIPGREYFQGGLRWKGNPLGWLARGRPCCLIRT